MGNALLSPPPERLETFFLWFTTLVPAFRDECLMRGSTASFEGAFSPYYVSPVLFYIWLRVHLSTKIALILEDKRLVIALPNHS